MNVAGVGRNWPGRTQNGFFTLWGVPFGPYNGGPT